MGGSRAEEAPDGAQPKRDAGREQGQRGWMAWLGITGGEVEACGVDWAGLGAQHMSWHLLSRELGRLGGSILL